MVDYLLSLEPVSHSLRVLVQAGSVPRNLGPLEPNYCVPKLPVAPKLDSRDFHVISLSPLKNVAHHAAYSVPIRGASTKKIQGPENTQDIMN